MKQISLIMMVVVIAFCTSCKKAPETPKGSSKIVLGQTTVNSVSGTGVSVSTALTEAVPNSITEHGYCWGTQENPDVQGTHHNLGSMNSPGTFTYEITGLQPQTRYFIKPYASDKFNTIYGNQVEATTTSINLPQVTTVDITNITPTSAICGGNVTSGTSVTARGVCWSTSHLPTVANSHTINGSGTGSFVSNLTGLSSSTLYYVRAYATNSVGTAYGNEVNFTTLTNPVIPIVTTTTVTNITSTTATSGGNVTSDGGAAVTARGVCWSTTANPTTANSHTTNGSGTGSFTSNLTGLTPGTLYYIRAYATNSVGTAYGNEVSFTTLSSGGQPCPGIPTVTYEGKTYNTVLIGTQCWFKENLNVGTRINGSQNQTNNGIKEKYCYDDLESNCNIYGGLYQWDEMMQYVTTQGVKGICPDGWHIPTDAEWTTLTNYLGGESVAGGKMKEAGYAHWASPNTGATNTSGFTALPGGGRGTDGSFDGLTYYAYFWSSTEYSSTYAWYRGLDYDYDDVGRGLNYKTGGFSCRCLQD